MKRLLLAIPLVAAMGACRAKHEAVSAASTEEERHEESSRIGVISLLDSLCLTSELELISPELSFTADSNGGGQTTLKAEKIMVRKNARRETNCSQSFADVAEIDSSKESAERSESHTGVGSGGWPVVAACAVALIALVLIRRVIS